MPELPHVCAFLVCDHVWQDPHTGKWTLLGVFDTLWASREPITHGPFAVYLNLTNMRGEYNLALRLLRASDELVCAEKGAAAPYVVADPLARTVVVALLEGFTVPTLGKYLLRLLANGEAVQDVVLMARRIGASR
jgi:hypothetical protein